MTPDMQRLAELANQECTCQHPDICERCLNILALIDELGTRYAGDGTPPNLVERLTGAVPA